MTINRRGLLGAMLAACAAPAVVRAGSLMRINPAIVVPPAFLLPSVFNVKDFGAIGDGVTDDSLAFRAAMDAAYEAAKYADVTIFLPGGIYRACDLAMALGSQRVR